MSVRTKDTGTDVIESIRVRGIVQGVGFRPTVWRIANEYGLAGEVHNDANGVLILFYIWENQARRKQVPRGKAMIKQIKI